MNIIKNISLNLVKTINSGVKLSGVMYSALPNSYEIIRKDLFSIEFPVSMGILEQLQVKAARPKVSNEQKTLQYKNLETYYKGKTKVDPMQIVFRDAIGPSIYQKLMQWQREHTDFATGKGGYAATYKKTLTLNIEDPTGAVIQQWKLYGCFITELDGGDLDMTSDDPAEISMTISIDSVEILF